MLPTVPWSAEISRSAKRSPRARSRLIVLCMHTEYQQRSRHLHCRALLRARPHSHLQFPLIATRAHPVDRQRVAVMDVSRVRIQLLGEVYRARRRCLKAPYRDRLVDFDLQRYAYLRQQLANLKSTWSGCIAARPRASISNFPRIILGMRKTAQSASKCVKMRAHSSPRRASPHAPSAMAQI